MLETHSVETLIQPLTSFMNFGKLLSHSEFLSICKKEIIVCTLGIRDNSHKMAYAPAPTLTITFVTSATHTLGQRCQAARRPDYYLSSREWMIFSGNGIKK